MRIPSLKEIAKRFDGADTVDDGVIGELSSPLCDLDMQTSFNMKAGNGSVSFARASGETGIDMYGDLVTKSVDEPVFNANGFQSREGSTNLNTYSSDLSTSYGSVGVAISNNVGIAPDGTTTVDRITEDNNSSYHYITKAFAIESGSVYTASRFVMKTSTKSIATIDIQNITDGNVARLEFNVQDGSVILSIGSYKIEDFGTYLRVQVTGTPTVTSGSRFFLGKSSYSGDGTSYLDTWGFQFEAKPFATPYIPTTDSPVTRATQFATLPAKYNMPSPTEGSICFDFKIKKLNPINSFILGVYLSSVEYLKVYINSSKGISLITRDGAKIIQNTTSDNILENTDYVYTARWKEGLLEVFLDGTLITYRTFTGNLFPTSILGSGIRFCGERGTLATVTNMELKNFKTYNFALSDTEIKLLQGGN